MTACASVFNISYLQVSGIPQGAHMSPDLCNLFLTYCEVLFLLDLPNLVDTDKVITIYKETKYTHRFMDDLRLYNALSLFLFLLNGSVYPPYLSLDLVFSSSSLPPKSSMFSSPFLELLTHVDNNHVYFTLYDK